MVRRNAIEILAAAFLGAFCSFLGGPSAAARGALLFGILAAGLTVTERLRGWRPVAIGGLFGAAAGVAAALIPEAGGWLERAEMTGVFPLNWGAVIGAAVCGGGWFAVWELDRRCALSTVESFVLCYLVAIGAFILKSAPDWWFPGAWQGAVAGSAAIHCRWRSAGWRRPESDNGERSGKFSLYAPPAVGSGGGFWRPCCWRAPPPFRCRF